MSEFAHLVYTAFTDNLVRVGPNLDFYFIYFIKFWCYSDWINDVQMLCKDTGKKVPLNLIIIITHHLKAFTSRHEVWFGQEDPAIGLLCMFWMFFSEVTQSTEI